MSARVFGMLPFLSFATGLGCCIVCLVRILPIVVIPHSANAPSFTFAYAAVESRVMMMMMSVMRSDVTGMVMCVARRDSCAALCGPGFRRCCRRWNRVGVHSHDVRMSMSVVDVVSRGMMVVMQMRYSVRSVMEVCTRTWYIHTCSCKDRFRLPQ